MKWTIIFSILFSINSFASQKISCLWEKSDHHQDNFYRPAKLEFEILDNQQVHITNNDFLKRKYSPCWVPGISSCWFSFDYDSSSPWEIKSQKKEEGKQGLQLEGEGFYWSPVLDINFSKELDQVKVGESISTLISGDDGDGVMFYDEKFNCQKI